MTTSRSDGERCDHRGGIAGPQCCKRAGHEGADLYKCAGDDMSKSIKNAAAHLREWPKVYRMGEHDAKVCTIAADGLDALEAKDQRIAELEREVSRLKATADLLARHDKALPSEATRKEASSDVCRECHGTCLTVISRTVGVEACPECSHE